MAKLTVETYWADGTTPELESVWTQENSSWTLAEWRKSVKSRSGFSHFDENGAAIFKPQGLVKQVVSLVE